VTEAIHDFTGKLRQPSLREHLSAYRGWRRDLRSARASGRPDPTPPAIAPISINLDLTTACNYRCDHCIDWDILNTKHRHDEETLRSSIITMVERGLRSVILIGGGEPTIYPGLLDFVRFLKDLELQIAVVSNGSRGRQAARDRRRARRARMGAASRSTPAATSCFRAMHKPVKKSLTLDEICEWIPKIKARNPKFSIGFSYIIVWGGATRERRRDPREHPRSRDGHRARARYGFDYIALKPVLERGAGRRRGDGSAGGPGHRPRDRADPHRGGRRPSCSRRRPSRCASPQPARARRGQLARVHPPAARVSHAGTAPVLTPMGRTTAPRTAAVDKARIGGTGRVLRRGDGADHRRPARRLMDRFDASHECREVTCLYNGVNWWLEKMDRRPARDVRRSSPATSASTSSCSAMALRRLLVRLPNPLGDAVMATPALRALRRGLPEVEIAVLGLPHHEGCCAGTGASTRIIPLRGSAWRDVVARARELRGRGYDAALVLPDSARAALDPFAARIPVRIGYARDLARRALLSHAIDSAARAREARRDLDDRALPARRARARRARCGRRARAPRAGRRRAARGRGLARAGVARGERVLLVTPGAAFGASKLWPPEHFARTCDELHRRFGLLPVIAPAPNAAEIAIARRVATAMSERHAALLEPDPRSRCSSRSSRARRSCSPTTPARATCGGARPPGRHAHGPDRPAPHRASARAPARALRGRRVPAVREERVPDRRPALPGAPRARARRGGRRGAARHGLTARVKRLAGWADPDAGGPRWKPICESPLKSSGSCPTASLCSEPTSGSGRQPEPRQAVRAARGGARGHAIASCSCPIPTSPSGSSCARWPGRSSRFGSSAPLGDPHALRPGVPRGARSARGRRPAPPAPDLGAAAAVGELAAGIAHEINNRSRSCARTFAARGDLEGAAPASGSREHAELLRDVDALFEESIEGVDRAAEIVRSVRSFAHVAGASRESTDLRPLLEDVLRVASGQLRSRVNVMREYDDALPA
jgi:ADP-heptose:LPS heptosyltransferase